MAAHYDFRLMLAVKLSRLLNVMVNPDEFTIGPRTDPTFPTTRESVITVNYRGRDVKIAYDRANLSSLNMLPLRTRKIVDNIESTTLYQLLPRINEKVGVTLSPDDVNDLSFGYGLHSAVITAKPTSRIWRGGFDFTFEFSDHTVIPHAVHDWRLNGAVTDYGSQPSNFIETPASYVVVDNKPFATFNTSRIALPVELPVTDNFTISFRVKTASKFKYMTMLAYGDGNATRGGFWLYNGRLYITGIGMTESQILNGPDISDGQPHVIQMRTLNGVADVYVDGALIITTPVAEFYPWNSIGDAAGYSARWPAGDAIGDIRYWDIALEDKELALVRGDSLLAPPLHHWPLAEDTINIGTSAVPWAGEVSWADFAGESWLSMPAANATDIGVDLPIATDFTLDAMLVLNHVGNSYCEIFTARNAKGAVGDLLTWRNIAASHRNAPTISGVGYSTYVDCKAKPFLDDTPTRLTIRRSGNTWSIYQQGVLMWTFTSTAKPAPWRWFSSLTKRRPKQYLRDLKYWPRALTSSEMAILHSS